MYADESQTQSQMPALQCHLIQKFTEKLRGRFRLTVFVDWGEFSTRFISEFFSWDLKIEFSGVCDKDLRQRTV